MSSLALIGYQPPNDFTNWNDAHCAPAAVNGQGLSLRARNNVKVETRLAASAWPPHASPTILPQRHIIPQAWDNRRRNIRAKVLQGLATGNSRHPSLGFYTDFTGVRIRARLEARRTRQEIEPALAAVPLLGHGFNRLHLSQERPEPRIFCKLSPITTSCPTSNSKSLSTTPTAP